MTNKNSAATQTICSLIAVLCVVFSGCTPPGPRALLHGKRLIDQGNATAAVPKLEQAVALLPKNALAWNYLGLAYHGSGQFEPAVRAYRMSLSLDHKLSPVRYNLGCLFLEQNNLPAATEELKSFTLLQPGAVEGWSKLGLAHLRARRLDEAERSLRTAIELQRDHPEALNSLGLVQVQRRRWQDALSFFSAAASLNPPYAPAVLNSAVVNHQYLNNRSLALQRYRDYLATTPAPSEREAVESIARQLERELAPALVSRPPAVIQPSGSAAPRSETTLPQPPVRPQPGNASPSPRTNTSVAGNRAVTSAPPSAAIPPAPIRAPQVEASRTISRTPTNAARSIEPTSSHPAEVEVTRVQTDLIVRQPQDLGAGAIPSQTNIHRSASTLATDASTNSARRGFFSRLNPFSTRPKTNQPAGTERESLERPAAPENSGSIPRYSFLNPAAPTTGSRADAEQAFKRGLKAHQNGRRAMAIKEYQTAVKEDPAYYDGYYNLGLVALDHGNPRLSLWAYEIALALRPESTDARYNFSLALKAAGYWLDAVDQLERIAEQHPSDARAHLSLANLYSQQLRDPERARSHYQRVLDLDPRHPDAGKIRFWLSANP